MNIAFLTLFDGFAELSGGAENASQSSIKQSTNRRRNRPALGDISANTSWKASGTPAASGANNNSVLQPRSVNTNAVPGSKAKASSTSKSKPEQKQSRQVRRVTNPIQLQNVHDASSVLQESKGSSQTKTEKKTSPRNLAKLDPSQWPDEELEYESFAGGRSSPTRTGLDEEERKDLGLGNIRPGPMSPPVETTRRPSLDGCLHNTPDWRSIVAAVDDDDILNFDLTDEENFVAKNSGQTNQKASSSREEETEELGL